MCPASATTRRTTVWKPRPAGRMANIEPSPKSLVNFSKTTKSQGKEWVRDTSGFYYTRSKTQAPGNSPVGEFHDPWAHGALRTVFWWLLLQRREIFRQKRFYYRDSILSWVNILIARVSTTNTGFLYLEGHDLPLNRTLFHGSLHLLLTRMCSPNSDQPYYKILEKKSPL